MNKRIFWLTSMFLGVMLLISQPFVMAATSFTDVTSNHWAVDEINFLSSKDIISGYQKSDGVYFYPERDVTRAQAAKMLILALGEKKAYVNSPTFSDVPTSHWASPYVERAVELGIFTGKDDGDFHPNDPVTRAQMSKIIVEAYNLRLPAGAPRTVFSDVYYTHWAASYAKTLYFNGVSNGNNGRFTPNENTNRGQFSAFLSRAMSPTYRLAIPAMYKGRVTATGLNVRNGPSSGSSTIGRIYLGETTSVYSIEGFWAKIKYNGNYAYVHKSYLKLFNLTGSTLENRIIVIDPGHGGDDPGALGFNMEEEDIVLDVSKRVRDRLAAAGAKVVMTRESDVYPSLSERVDLANKVFGENFASIHANSASAAAKGTETYYDTSTNANGLESQKLAQAIQTRLVDAINTTDRGIKDNSFFVIRNLDIPAVLVELAFISNSEDAAKLASNWYRDQMADAIYQGFVDYYRLP